MTTAGRRLPLALLALLMAAVLLAALAPSGSGGSANAAADPVVAVAGDIGVSDPEDGATAALVERIAPDMVLTTGDNAYEDGTQADYANNYDPDWGRFKAITKPSPGNHDYHVEAGDPPYYYTYFADQLPAENGGQYYATDIGAWRLYSLNCEIDCSETSAQVAWLRQDLATQGANKNKLAYLHTPRYSCGANHGSSSRPKALWRELIAARADLVLAGHDHNYQRFPRMDVDGNASPDGLASFVVGTGGRGLYPVGSGELGCDLAEYTQGTAHGVVRLRLGVADYSWEFVAVDDTVMDSGTAATLGTGTPTPTTTTTTPTSTSTATSTATGTATSTPTGTTGSVDVAVSSTSDDAEERSGSSVYLTSSDLELVTDGNRLQTVGVRFVAVGVPPGAAITSAYVQFQTDEVSTGPAALTVQGIAADDTPTFRTTAGDVSGRVRTAASVPWSPPDWPTVGARGPDQRTPDLAGLVQQVVDRQGWAAGNALGFVVTGSGRRVAESFDGSRAPVLHVDFTTGPPSNRAPLVDAGPDLTVATDEPAILDATVSDDGLPEPPTLTAAWTQVSGAGTATFSDASSVDTTATFSGPGDYALRLTADDTELTASDTVVVRVLAPGAVQTLAVPVRAGPDDAEERAGRSTSLSSSDLEMVEDKGRLQLVGLRFTGIDLPPGATVTGAYVQFQVDEVSTGPAALTVRGQAADDPAPFTSASGDISNRATTTATVGWTPPDWSAVGARGPGQRTPDLSAVVQEVVDRSGWRSGNALVLVVDGSGTRSAEAFDGSAPPVLHLEYRG